MKKVILLHTFNSEKDILEQRSLLESIYEYFDYVLYVDGESRLRSHPNLFIFDELTSLKSTDSTLELIKSDVKHFSNVNLVSDINDWYMKEEMLNTCVDKLRNEGYYDNPFVLWYFEINDMRRIDLIIEKTELLIKYPETKMISLDKLNREMGTAFVSEGQYFLSHYPLKLKEKIS